MRGCEQPLELWSIHLKFFREIILFKSKVWWERENIIGGKNFDGCFPLLGIPFSNLLLLLMLTKQLYILSFLPFDEFSISKELSITIPLIFHMFLMFSIPLQFYCHSVCIPSPSCSVSFLSRWGLAQGIIKMEAELKNKYSLLYISLFTILDWCFLCVRAMYE